MSIPSWADRSDRIRAEAPNIRLGRGLLTLLIGVFWLVGWLAGQISVGIGFAFAAIKVGWQDAREQKAGPRGRAP